MNAMTKITSAAIVRITLTVSGDILPSWFGHLEPEDAQKNQQNHGI